MKEAKLFMSVNNSSTKKTKAETLEEQFVECVRKAQAEGYWPKGYYVRKIPNMAQEIFSQKKKEMVDDILEQIQKQVIACEGKIMTHISFSYWLLERRMLYSFTDDTLHSLQHLVNESLTKKLDSMIGFENYLLIVKYEKHGIFQNEIEFRYSFYSHND